MVVAASAAASHMMHVINNLQQNATRIGFYRKNKKEEHAEWWDMPLIEYADGNQQSAWMQAVLKETGVSLCKVTHQHTQAVQHGGAKGLAPLQIANRHHPEVYDGKAVFSVLS